MKKQDYDLLFQQMYHKIETIAENNARLRDKFQALQTEVNYLKDVIQKKDAQIQALKSKNVQVQMAKGIYAHAQPEVIFQKINQLEKEISQCIVLLDD